MRTVFFGTPEWSVPSLRSLASSDIEVAAVVTNPDRPAGRGMTLSPSPVKQAAIDLGLEVIQNKARDPLLRERLSELSPDVAVVVAYGSILPVSLLEVPSKGFVNLHFSLLPAYRGAAPVQRAIMNGDDVSGVSIMVLTEGMDEGPILARTEAPVSASDSAGTYGARLAEVGAELLVGTVRGYVTGEIQPQPQDDAAASYAPKLTTEDARIDWSSTSEQICNFVRGLDPEPGAWTTLSGARLKVFKATSTEIDGLTPGQVTATEDLVVGTSDGAVALEEVQPATKRRMTGPDLARGLRLTGDDRMGE